MVKNVFFVVLFSLAHFSLMFADDADYSVNVSAQIDAYGSFENHPIQGSVSITHDANTEIDTSSFKIKNAPLKVDLIKSVKMSPQSNVELSIFHFELPGQSKGLYVLPEITVKVGKNTYSSIPSSYEVTGAAPAPKHVETPKATLVLKASIEAPPSTYPGHLLTVVYQYLYTGDIELITEYLPLLEAKGFQKVGDKTVTNTLENNISVRKVSQQIKALTSGEFNFEPSYVEGYGYIEEGPLKKRTYIQPKLRSETPPMTITVNPFPTKGKPASFNGAVGEFTLQTSLLTDPNVQVDDKMQLAIDIGGVADLFDVPMPSLNPLKSLFRLSDLPPTILSDKSTKRFVVDLFPLSTAIKEVPPIEFSYLEPLSGIYVTLKSNPIPIKVTAKNGASPTSATSPAIPPPPPPPPRQQAIAPAQPPTPPTIQKPESIEIATNYILFASDLKNVSFGTWDVFWLIPLSAFLIGLQLWMMNYLANKARIVKQKNSADVFAEVMRAPVNSPDFFQKLARAFFLRLAERKEIPSPNITAEQLPTTGAPGEVRRFLSTLEEKRFTGTKELSETEIRKEAQQLFNKLQQQ